MHTQAAQPGERHEGECTVELRKRKRKLTERGKEYQQDILRKELKDSFCSVTNTIRDKGLYGGGRDTSHREDRICKFKKSCGTI